MPRAVAISSAISAIKAIVFQVVERCFGVVFAAVFRVVATRIKEIQPGMVNDRTSNLPGPPSRSFHGYTLMAPKVGNGLVLYRDHDGRRMVTTAIRRLLRTESEKVLYIETENSVYRLHIESSAPDQFKLEVAATP